MNSKLIAYGGLLVAVQAFLISVETFLVSNDLGTPGILHWIKALAGGVIILGTAAGGVYVAYSKFTQAQTTAVNAGIALAVSGDAVDKEGNTIPAYQSSTGTPPLPATADTAKAIVQKYG